MQLYALDAHNRLVFANQAKKQQDYFCLECRSIIRMRGGMHRQNHFYHVEPARNCRQNGKTVEHIQTQLFIQKQLPEGEAIIEKPFPEINRIADVAWLPQKIIFEIQCSTIPAKEVEQRNADYESLGFQVVWILHDKRFNQWKMSAAELFLQRRPHYFTTMNAKGKGIIYDKYDVVLRGTRKHLLGPYPVEIEKLKPIDKETIGHSTLPKIVKERMAHWSYCFANDLSYLCLADKPNDVLTEILKIEAEMHQSHRTTFLNTVKHVFYRLIIRPYKLFFQILLERACR